MYQVANLVKVCGDFIGMCLEHFIDLDGPVGSFRTFLGDIDTCTTGPSDLLDPRFIRSRLEISMMKTK